MCLCVCIRAWLNGVTNMTKCNCIWQNHNHNSTWVSSLLIFSGNALRVTYSMFIESGAVWCRCGDNTRREVTDMGEVGNWPLFPIMSLRLGDTGKSWEHMYFQIGPLVCKQGTPYNHVHLLHEVFAFDWIDIHKFWPYISNYNHMHHWVQRQCINISTRNRDFLISFQYKYKSTSSCNWMVNSDTRQLEWQYLIHLWNNTLIILSFTVFIKHLMICQHPDNFGIEEIEET